MKKIIILLSVLLLVFQLAAAEPLGRPFLIIGQVYINDELVKEGDDVTVMALLNNQMLDYYEFSTASIDKYLLEINMATQTGSGYATIDASLKITVNDVEAAESPIVIPEYYHVQQQDLHIYTSDYQPPAEQSEEEEEQESSGSGSSGGSSGGGGGGIITPPMPPEPIVENDTVEEPEDKPKEEVISVPPEPEEAELPEDSVEVEQPVVSEDSFVTAKVILGRLSEPKNLMLVGAVLFFVAGVLFLLTSGRRRSF